MSAIYHFLYPNKAKRVFRIFDHCTIYVLICGTYAPVCFMPWLIESVGMGGALLILFGGISYTIGVIFFALGKKVRYFHSIWHIFDILGTALQFLGILIYGIIL